MAFSKNILDLDLTVLDDSASFSDLGRAFRELERISPPETPYLCSDFLIPWLTYASKRADLHTLILRKDDQVTAMLPLVSDTVKKGPITIPRLGFPTQVGGHPPSFDFRYAERDAALVAEVLLSTFARRGAPWRVLSLRHLLGNSALLHVLPGMCEERGLIYSRFPSRRESYLVLSGDWHSYIARVGHKVRQQLGKGHRNIERVGGWEFAHHWPGEEEIPNLLERYIRLIRASWKSYQADDRDFVSLLEDVMRSFARSGDLLMSWLQGPGVDGAGIIQLRRGGVLSSFHVAYMEDCPITGSGTLLKGSAISFAFDEGVPIYDFSTYAEHIHRWYTNYRSTANVYITKKSPTGWLIQRQMKKREYKLESAAPCETHE